MEHKWKDTPLNRFMLLVAVVVIGTLGWQYFSKQSACEKRIDFVPESSLGSGEYYQLASKNPFDFGGGRKFATHQEAMTACVRE